ncbi:MAG: hypothetical protein GY928_35540 [Colwellia sp.]|nr:hypothetical protein [Colwellia sp.]
MYKVLEYDSEDFADPLTLSAKRHIELSKYTNSAARGVMNRSKQRRKRRTNKPQKQLRKKRTHPSERKAGAKLIPYLPKKKRKLAVLNVEPTPPSNPRKRNRRSHGTSSSKTQGSKLNGRSKRAVMVCISKASKNNGNSSKNKRNTLNSW